MVKTAIYVTLIALSACSVLAEVTEEYGRREVHDSDLLARDIIEEREYTPTIFSREEDTESLQEREPFFFLGPLIGMAARTAVQAGVRAGARAATRAATKAGTKAVKHEVKNQVSNAAQNQQQNNKKGKRELAAGDDELEEEFAREGLDELVERELGLIDSDEEVLEREVDEMYLD